MITVMIGLLKHLLKLSYKVKVTIDPQSPTITQPAPGKGLDAYHTYPTIWIVQDY